MIIYSLNISIYRFFVNEIIFISDILFRHTKIHYIILCAHPNITLKSFIFIQHNT